MTSFDEKLRPAKSFCDKMKPCAPANKVSQILGEKPFFFRFFFVFWYYPKFFNRFFWYYPKFFNRFCTFRLHCVQDISTNNSFFLSNILCFNDFMTKNLKKWYNLQTVPPIFTFEVGKCSKRFVNQRLICVVWPLFGFAKLEAIVCITTRKMCGFRQVSKRFPNS